MSRDDRDIESSNPSKSFKVGDFDRLSGFFTPVWESKRKIRSESPIPASGPASSKSGAAKPATNAAGAVASSPAVAPVEEKPPAPAKLEAAPAAVPAEKEPAAGGSAPVKASTASRAPDKISKESKDASRKPNGLTARTAAEAAAVPTAASPAAPRPSVAALKQAGPNLPAEAFLDPKPDFRAPLSKFTPAPQAERITNNQRSLRASVAATRVHEQLRARSQPDSFQAPELQWGTETDREVTAASSATSETSASSDDTYPLHLLRRLRRTIHLSTPLPQAVREMIARYGRN